MTLSLHLSPIGQHALAHHLPLVALESTLITHGLPRPANLEVARKLGQVVTDNGAIHVRLEPHEFVNSQVHRSPCRIRSTFADQSFMLYYARCQTRLSRRS